MAYDEKLASRVREILASDKGISEKPMFGGLTFMLNNNMVCGVEKNRLMVRVGPDQHDELVEEPGAKIMDLTGKPMKGFLFVDPSALKTKQQLAFWIDRASRFVTTLPKKKPRTAKRK